MAIRRHIIACCFACLIGLAGVTGCTDATPPPSPPADAAVLRQIVDVYQTPHRGIDSVPAVEPGHPAYTSRLITWRAQYASLHKQYEAIENAGVTPRDRYTQRTLGHLMDLTQMAIADIDAVLASPPAEDSPAYEAFATRFLVFNVATADRISVVQARLGQEVTPK